LDRGIGDHLVHRRSQSFEQQRITIRIGEEQLRASVPIRETQHGRLESKLPSIAGNSDLQHRICAAGPRHLGHERCVPTAQSRSDAQRPVVCE
jgi:hypothetical protein